MRIDIWSDVVCPFCYIGKRHLEAALAKTPGGGEAEVVWHSFELDPNAPADAGSHTELLAAKYGMSEAQVHAADASLTAQAAAVGLDFKLAQSRPGNSFDAHRLIHFAAEHGFAGVLKERLFRAYFSESAAIGDRATLLRCAVEIGLNADAAAKVLATDDYSDEVRADEAQAHDLGISGVPFFVIDRQLAVSGAQPIEVFQRAFAQTAANRAIRT